MGAGVLAGSSDEVDVSASRLVCAPRRCGRATATRGRVRRWGVMAAPCRGLPDPAWSVPSTPRGEAGASPPPATGPKRYCGTVALDPARVGRDAGRIAEEVVSHLAGLVGARVRVTLEIEAQIPDSAPEQVVRVVTENSRTLKSMTHGFEDE